MFALSAQHTDIRLAPSRFRASCPSREPRAPPQPHQAPFYVLTGLSHHPIRPLRLNMRRQTSCSLICASSPITMLSTAPNFTLLQTRDCGRLRRLDHRRQRQRGDQISSPDAGASSDGDAVVLNGSFLGVWRSSRHLHRALAFAHSSPLDCLGRFVAHPRRHSPGTCRPCFSGNPEKRQYALRPCVSACSSPVLGIFPNDVYAD